VFVFVFVFVFVSRRVTIRREYMLVHAFTEQFKNYRTSLYSV
jgi:protein-S-isoprenylcysteine O-methyltransferase Ste14